MYVLSVAAFVLQVTENPYGPQSLKRLLSGLLQRDFCLFLLYTFQGAVPGVLSLGFYALPLSLAGQM